jgi:hypothetical protein
MTAAITAIGDEYGEATRDVIAAYLTRVADAMTAFTDTSAHAH